MHFRVPPIFTLPEVDLELGFALICTDRSAAYREGAALIVGSLMIDGQLAVRRVDALNALGFALVRMKNFIAAEAAFQVGTDIVSASTVEREGPITILWNNLAAVQMLQGRFHEARMSFVQIDYSNDRDYPLFQRNLQMLVQIVSGELTTPKGLPELELFVLERPHEVNHALMQHNFSSVFSTAFGAGFL